MPQLLFLFYHFDGLFALEKVGREKAHVVQFVLFHFEARLDELGAPALVWADVLVAHRHSAAKALVVVINDAVVAPLAVELDALDEVVAVLLDGDEVAAGPQRLVKDAEAVLQGFEVVEGVLHDDDVLGACLDLRGKDILVADLYERGVAVLRPVFKPTGYFLEIEFERRAPAGDAVHSQEYLGGGVAAAAVPDAERVKV